MAGILIRDALIISLDKQMPPSFRGDLLLGENRVQAVAARPDLIEPGRFDRIVDARSLIVMPGFVNTHGHVSMTLFRGLNDDMPLEQWLKRIFSMEEHLTPRDVFWGAMLGLAEMIRAGTTTFTDMYYYADSVAEAAVSSGIRAVLSPGLIGLWERAEEALAETDAFIDRWQGASGGKIDVLVGPHAPYTCPPDFLRKTMELAGRKGRPLQIHLSETRQEVDIALREWGVTPTRHLHDLGFLDYPVIAAHCVHVDQADLELLAEKKVGVAHAPGSNLKLGSGIAPLTEMLNLGIPVGLGTDGAASNNNLDMLEEMRLTALLAGKDTFSPLNPEVALNLATVGGARILGLENTGIIKTGWKADLIGLRTDCLHGTPLADPLTHVLFSASASDVDLVIADGVVLFEKGELKTLDEEKIMFEASKCSRRLTGGEDHVKE